MCQRLLREARGLQLAVAGLRGQSWKPAAALRRGVPKALALCRIQNFV